MRVVRTVSLVLGTVAIACIVVASALTAWLRWEASRPYEPDSPKPFYEPIQIAEDLSDSRSMFRVERVGDRYEIVDYAGRVVVFRGVTADGGAGKHPFRPVAMGDVDAFGRLVERGVNAIRLSVPWRSLEKGPRVFDVDHLEYIRWFMDVAKRHDMAVIIQNDRGRAADCLTSTGAPPWAHRGTDGGEASSGECIEEGLADLGDLPGRLRWWADFWDGTWTPDDLALQDHAIWSFYKLAEVLQRQQALLGYGMLDEPPCLDDVPESLVYPGEEGCERSLSDFYRRFATTVRNVDRDALFFFEPAVRPALGPWDGRTTGLSKAPLRGSVFMVHFGTSGSLPGGVGLDEFIVNSRRLAAWGFGTPVALAGIESGDGGPGRARRLAEAMKSIEQARVSSFAWEYDGEAAPSCSDGAFVRPYPKRIAGIPVSFGLDRSFDYDGGLSDANTDVFTLVFDQGGTVADTLVYVPRSLVYGEDPDTEAPEFIVEVSDGSWKWSDRDPNTLVWTADPDIRRHTLTIEPWGGRPAPGNGIGDCTP